MRWTWLIPRLILIALIWTLTAFGFDPLLRYAAIQSAQSVTGARVDVASLSTGFFPPVLQADTVAMASASKPGTNLVEIDHVDFDVAGSPLLHRSLVIDQASLSGVRFGTVRHDDGQLAESAAAPAEPSWLSEKLKDVGHAWLQQLVVDVRQQLDPNSLETWRTSQQLQEKWKDRADDLQQQLRDFQPRVDRLQQQMEEVKSLPPVAQLEQYVQLAAEGQKLVAEANLLQQQIRGIPTEARHDFSTLDAARRRDQEQVVQRVRSLKPSPQSITESLIGPQMYRQLHQATSWLQLGTSYQKQIRQQTKVVRHRGQDFDFPLLNPTPQFLCRRAELSGKITIGEQLAPFEGVLTDVTSDPKLLGRPTEFQLRTSGLSPMKLAVRYDATTAETVTDLAVELTQPQPGAIQVGDADTGSLTASLSSMQWSARLRLVDGAIQGKVRLHAGIGGTQLQSERMPALLRAEVSQVFAALDTIDATLLLSGRLDQPQLEIQSDVGQRIAAGMQSAFARQAEQWKQSLTTKVNEIAQSETNQLSQKLNTRYQGLLSQHGDMLSQLKGVQTLLASVQGGQSNPGDLFRQVSGTGLIPSNKSRKTKQVQDQLDQAGNLLQGLGGSIFR